MCTTQHDIDNNTNNVHIGLECRLIANLVMRTVNESQVFRNNNYITGVQGWVLRYLYDHQGEQVFQKDMEKRFNVRRSTVTQTLTLMEQRGLIVRHSVDKDARLKRLELTDKAIVIQQQIIAEIDRVEKEMLQNLSAEQLRVCVDVLATIKANLLAMKVQTDAVEI